MAWASELARRLPVRSPISANSSVAQRRGEVATVSAGVSDAREALEDHIAKIGELAYPSLDGCG